MKKKALICDDDPLILALLGRLFARRGYEVAAYSDAVDCPLYQAPACPCAVVQCCPDVILTDLSMPVVNGLDFVETQVKKGCKCPHIALMSGRWAESDLQRAVALGVKFFPKPFYSEQINAWLDEIERGSALFRGQVSPFPRYAGGLAGATRNTTAVSGGTSQRSVSP